MDTSDISRFDHSAIDKLPINEDLVLEADKGFRQLASKAA